MNRRRKIWIIDGAKLIGIMAHLDEIGCAWRRHKAGHLERINPGEFTTGRRRDAVRRAKENLHNRAENMRLEADTIDEIADGLK